MYRHIVTVPAMKCLHCQVIIYSRYSGEFRNCRCDSCYIDTCYNGVTMEVYYTRMLGSRDKYETLQIEIEHPMWQRISIASRLYGGEEV
jgi:hypothetical protein